MTEISTPTASGKDATTENFPVARYIRIEHQGAVAAYYLFARTADDIGDDPLMEANEKIARLEKLGEDLTKESETTIDCCRFLKQTLKEKNIPAAHALDLLTAFKRDALKNRYADFGELLDYCRYSAAPVGRFLLDLHGEDRATWQAGDVLCSALQILNHIQDCADDYRTLDRVYLPLDLLTRHATNPDALAAPACTPDLRAALTDLLNQTAPLIRQARTLPAQIKDPMLRFNVSVIVAVAEKLDALLRKNDPLCEDVKLSKAAKLAAALTGAWRWITKR